MIGWNVHKELNPEYLADSAMLSGTDFKVDHNKNFDINYLRIVKQPGKGRICIIGNASPPDRNWFNADRK